MRDNVLKLLKEKEIALTVEQINDSLGLKGVEQLKELLSTLDELQTEGLIFRTKRDKYMDFEKCHLKTGRLQMNSKGFGFVITKEQDVYIDSKDINGAIDGDIVLIELHETKNNKSNEGKIIKIIDRDLDTVVATVKVINNDITLELDDKKKQVYIELDENSKEGLVDGHKVLVKLVRQISNNKYKGEVEKIIGHKDDASIDILTVAYKNGFAPDFSEETIEELKDIPDEVSQKEIEKRKDHDLRDKMIFTIDGDDTKDIDDAISIEKLENENYKLGVHIADVAYYVKEGTALYNDAMDRGTSCYLASTVIPMLPHQLSNGICSLNPDVDRLAVSCEMEINKNGKVISYDVFESVIKSNIQMTYKNVNKILEENIIPDGYEKYADTLKLMNELSDILRKNMTNRGYIDFDQDEAKVITDTEGKVVDIKLRERGIGENLIENFMIAANESVASYVTNLDLPFIYRIHEYPEEEKLDRFLNFVSLLGYKLTGKKTLSDPKVVQNLLSQLKDVKEYKILSRMLLRTMKKAEYRKENLGHFGLASECYTHFTSPIRRFPDTTVHGLLKDFVFSGNISREIINKWSEKLIYIAEHSSEKERASIEAEREVDDMKMAEYMENHIGEEFDAMIDSVTNFGMFVELNNLVEGLVHVNDMTDDHYMFDENALRLTGQRTGKIYKIGDTIRVKCIASSKEERKIDFSIVNDNTKSLSSEKEKVFKKIK